MYSNGSLPSLEGWEDTRDTLHTYARVIGVIPRTLAKPDPRWWHISLKLNDDLLWTDPIHHPSIDRRELRLNMDLRTHRINIQAGQEYLESYEMTAAPSGAELAGQISKCLAELGIQAEFDWEGVENDQIRKYDPDSAAHYLTALKLVHAAQAEVKANLDGETGPIQLWPHNFDQAFEWFGGREIVHRQGGKESRSQAQINFGFAPGDKSHASPYFYSNPWPFDPGFISIRLASGARWFDGSWQGSILPYESLVDDQHANTALIEYYLSVYTGVAPSLQE
jgi:hypothetical protein